MAEQTTSKLSHGGAEEVSGLVQSVETKVRERKDGNGTFEMTTVTINDVKATGFTNKLGDLPESGDSVTMRYQPVKNGKYTNNNIVSLSKADSKTDDREVSHHTTSKSVQKRIEAQEVKIHLPVTTLPATSKDISMEVSGLAQALLSTGHYHSIRHNDQYNSNDIFLSEKLLEVHLRMALNLKRKIASELEDKGSV